MTEAVYDVVIIGGGPGGWAAAIYTARANLATLVLDRPGQGGSWGKAAHIANYPGVPGPISGAALVGVMREQARSFGAQFREEVVIGVQLDGDPKMVATAEEGLYGAHAVIIASGAMERSTRVPGEERYLGRGVSTCATCDGAFFRGGIVIAVGGDQYAVEEALSLSRFARTVYLLVPFAELAIPDALRAELDAHPAIEVRLSTRVREILGNERMHAARITGPEGDSELAADGLFMYLAGAKPTTGFLREALPVNTDGAILVHPDQSTVVPRVYAVGDVTADHIRQVIVAAAEGAVAALAADRDLRARARITPDYH